MNSMEVTLLNWLYNIVLSKLDILLKYILLVILGIRRNHYCVMGDNHSHKVRISNQNLNQIYRLKIFWMENMIKIRVNMTIIIVIDR